MRPSTLKQHSRQIIAQKLIFLDMSNTEASKYTGQNKSNFERCIFGPLDN